MTQRTSWQKPGLKGWRAGDRGVAFFPAVPGLAPWGFYAGETAGEERNPVWPGVCHIEAPSASWGTVTRRTSWQKPGLKGWRAGDRGVAFLPAVPGLAPWGFYAGETAGEIAILFDPACAT